MPFTRTETVSVVPLLTPSVGLADDVVAGVELQAANATATATVAMETQRSLILASPIESPRRHYADSIAAKPGSICRSVATGQRPLTSDAD